MKKNILKFPAPSRLPALARYDASSDPADYLEAIEETFRGKMPLRPLVDRLASFSESAKATDHRASLLIQAGRLLAKINFSPTEKRHKQVPPSRGDDLSDEMKEQMDALANAFSMHQKAREDLRNKVENSPYKAYPPAYPYVDAIAQVFGENDPVKTVCDYLCALQPTGPSHHSDDCWFSDEERFDLTEEEIEFLLHQVLPQLAPPDAIKAPKDGEYILWVVLHSLYPFFSGFFKPLSEKHSAFDLAIPSGKTVEQLTTSEKDELIRSVMMNFLPTFDGFLFLFFGNHCAVPQGLFVAVLRYWTDSGARIAESEASRGILRSLVNFPVGRPARSWEDISSGVADPAWLKSAKAIYKEPGLVPFLPCRMSGVEWFFRLSDSAVASQFRHDNGTDFSSLVLGAWSRKITMLRDGRLGGRYPWRVQAEVQYLYDDYEISSADWDTHLHFLALFIEEEESGEWGWEGDLYGDNHINGFRSFALHRNFWLAADREGYPELGNAVFAFYLLRKSIRDAKEHDHLEVDWTLFSEQLRSALERPGHGMVRRAIEFMKGTCNQKKWTLDLLRLRNVLPDSAEIVPISIANIYPTADPIGLSINEEIMRLVGPELWNRFSARSRKLLVEAEVRFQETARRFGSDITEFGLDLVAYALPFENELNERLMEIYRSSEVSDYWSKQYPKQTLSTNPTIGSYLKLLGSKLPQDVVTLTETAGVTVQSNQGLLKRLGILRDARNQGAHTTKAVTPKQLWLQRAAVLNEHLLRDFLQALKPHAVA